MWNLFWFIAAIVMFVLYAALLFVRPSRNFTGRGKTICVVSAMFMSLFFLETAVNIRYEMTLTEIIFSGIAETLKIFTLNGEYGGFIADVRDTLSVLEKDCLSDWAVFFSSLIYILAPITIGTIIIEMLSSILPKIKMFFLWLIPWKKVIYFSELNERSLVLAQSIQSEGEDKGNLFKRPIIVFANVNSDEGENTVNLKLSARENRGICFRSDLMYIGIRKKRRSEIFLIDSDEQKNLQLLSKLGEVAERGHLKKARIYVFARDEAATRIKQELQYRLGKTCGEDKMPDIKLISGHKHIVRNLLYDVPLYEPLIGRVNPAEEYELNVTIFGAGSIGEEMFLATYWYGQMLNCRLSINVISRESREQFEERINYINPDILKTTLSGSDILRIYDDREVYAEPYFKFRYYSTELDGGDIEDKLKTPMEDGFEPINSDYFMIALGSDEADLMLAQVVGKAVGMHNLKKKQGKNAVVAYVIYNSDLCEILNGARSAKRRVNTGVYMHAFGSFREFYSTKNVRMETGRKAAMQISDSYEKRANDSIKAGFANNFRKPDYKYWADIARALHIKYKVFSAGYIKTPLWSCSDDDEKMAENNRVLEEYKKIIPNNNDTDAEKREKRDAKLYKELAWLEHRRWNAFMRTGGFRYENFELYSKDINDYRCFEMRYQPCIVEGDKNGVTDGLFERTDTDGLDRLDKEIYKIHKTDWADDNKAEDKRVTNLKEYDYPEFDFDDNI